MTETKIAAQPKAAKNPSTVDYRSRESRKPLSGLRQRLSADIPAGLTGRWVLDEPGRLSRFIQAGWKFASNADGVTREQDDRDGAIYEEHASESRSGQSIRQYLMLIPTELYEQDRAASQAEIDAREQQFQRGQGTQMAPEDHVHIPEGLSNRIRDTLNSTSQE